jgi:hypothetical protein
VVGAEYSSFFINLDNYDPWCWPSTPQPRATPSETKPQGSFLVIMDIMLWISQIRESKIFQSWLFFVPWYYLLSYFFPVDLLLLLSFIDSATWLSSWKRDTVPCWLINFTLRVNHIHWRSFNIQQIHHLVHLSCGPWHRKRTCIFP